MTDLRSKINVSYKTETSKFFEVYAEIFKRQVELRSSVELSFNQDKADLIWSIDPKLAEESFAIEENLEGVIIISGGRPRALLYGIGKFLRTSNYSAEGMEFSEWRGTSTPAKSFRCSYFATHFKNYFEEAPIEEIERYVEELGLWGFNMIGTWFDYHHFNNFQEAKAKEMFKHICSILRAAKRIDLKVASSFLANEAYNNSPVELRATPTGRSFYGVELCPNKTGAIEIMMKWFAEELQGYVDEAIEIDHFSSGPYDQGGCGCATCKPWGANGYLLMSEKISRLAKEYFPKSTFSVNTWLFDLKSDQGEWRGLDEAFKTPPNWVDYIQAGAHGKFPQYPIENGVPGNLPMFDFPEISMYGMYPWGGFGANPLALRFKELWGNVCDLVFGARLYCEGIYEDFNKVLYSRFLWNGNNDIKEAVNEYFHYECGCENSQEALEAILLLEKNHAPMWFTESYVNRFPASKKKFKKLPNNYGGYYNPREIDPQTANTALAICKRVMGKLPDWGSNGWRWQIIYLRAQIDAELHNNNGEPTPFCEELFAKLTKLYHAENGEAKVSPPTREAMLADRTSVIMV